MKIAAPALLALLGTVCAAPVADSSAANLPGLNSTQTANARAIIRAVQKDKVGAQGCHAAVTWALTWTDLINYASRSVPKSLAYHHDAVGGSGGDHLGVFQWRAEFYPDLAQVMDPEAAAGIFVTQMKKIEGWKTKNVASLCEDMVVQGLYPFGQHVLSAEKICHAGGV